MTEVQELVRSLYDQSVEVAYPDRVEPDGERAIKGWLAEALVHGDTSLVEDIERLGVGPLAKEWERVNDGD